MFPFSQRRKVSLDVVELRLAAFLRQSLATACVPWFNHVCIAVEKVIRLCGYKLKLESFSWFRFNVCMLSLVNLASLVLWFDKLAIFEIDLGTHLLRSLWAEFWQFRLIVGRFLYVMAPPGTHTLWLGRSFSLSGSNSRVGSHYARWEKVHVEGSN